MTNKTLDLCESAWSALVDAEAALHESEPYSPHGWVTLGDVMEDEKLNPPFPVAAGIEALTMAPLKSLATSRPTIPALRMLSRTEYNPSTLGVKSDGMTFPAAMPPSTTSV